MMPNDVPQNADAAARPRPARKFQKWALPSALSPAQGRRQTEVLRAACDKLFPRGIAIAFLNAHNETLGGKPLQLALDSDDGLLRVEQLIATMSEVERGAIS